MAAYTLSIQVGRDINDNIWYPNRDSDGDVFNYPEFPMGAHNTYIPDKERGRRADQFFATIGSAL